MFHFYAWRPIVTPEGEGWKWFRGIHPTWVDRCLMQSSWRNCKPSSQFCFPNFSTFSLSCWEAILITPEREAWKWERGIFQTRVDWVPGAFKLDHLQPFEPIFSQIVQLFPLSCREVKFLLLKGEFSQPEWIGCLGHSSWTICNQLSQFCCSNF